MTGKKKKREGLLFVLIVILALIFVGGILLVRQRIAEANRRQNVLINTIEYRWYLESSDSLPWTGQGEKSAKENRARRELQRIAVGRLAAKGFTGRELARAFGLQKGEVEELLR